MIRIMTKIKVNFKDMGYILETALYTYINHKEMSKRQIYLDIIRPTTIKYTHYLNTYLKGFIEKAGYKKDINIEIRAGAHLSGSWAHLIWEQIDLALEKSKPFAIFVELRPFKLKLSSYCDEYCYRKDATLDFDKFSEYTVTLLIETLIHETIHIVQYIIKEKKLYDIEKTRIKQEIISEENLLHTFIKLLNRMYESNQRFIKTTKLEGEAKYFSTGLKTYYSKNYPDTKPSKLFKFTKNFEKDIYETNLKTYEKGLDKYIAEQLRIIEILKQNYAEIEKIIKLTFEVIQLGGDIGKTKAIELKLKKIILDFKSNLNILEAEIKKIHLLDNDVYLTEKTLYKLGYIITYALKNERQYRYTMNARTMFDKFIDMNAYREANKLRTKLRRLLKIVDEVDKIIVNFERILPKDKSELELIYAKISDLSKPSTILGPSLFKAGIPASP